jgi:oxygen-dependent protoporphyrinogen oxidase
MKIKGEPEFINISRWEKAIPQYELGYYKVLESIEKFENENKGIYICANYKGGIGVGDCVISADNLVRRIVSQHLC